MEVVNGDRGITHKDYNFRFDSEELKQIITDSETIQEVSLKVREILETNLKPIYEVEENQYLEEDLSKADIALHAYIKIRKLMTK